jgi:hypothetical protein
MNGWSAEKRAAYSQGMRVVPAMMAARYRGSTDDAMELLRGYFNEQAERSGQIPCELWAVLFSAAMTWFSNTVRAVADVAEEDPQQLLQRMSVAAATWEAEGGL